jgi:fumarate hydratase subunit beta
MKPIKVTLPLTDSVISTLQAGDLVHLSGVVYTARDAAHARLFEALSRHEALPIDVVGQTVYYVGPTPAQPGQVVGSAGPTSSYRMDPFTPALLEHGLKGIIGKGDRSSAVIDALKRNHAVYFTAIGGLGALISESIVASEVIAYPDLGTEAIHRFVVADFPAIVTIDCFGNNLYTTQQALYRKEPHE